MYISVLSGKGGTGKTIIATSLALSLKNCTYIDLDVEEPNGAFFIKPEIEDEIVFNVPIPEINENICTFCKKCADACTYSAISIIPTVKKALVFPDLCHSCGVCTYVCPVEGAIKEIDKEIGQIRIGRRGDLRFIEGKIKVGEPSAVPLISGILEEYVDYFRNNIVDSPPGSSCPVVEGMKKCDYALLVTEPTPFGLSDLKLVVEIVKDMKKKAGVIINKSRSDFYEMYEYLRKMDIPVVMKIPYSMEIQKKYSQGIPLIEVLPNIRDDFRALYERIKNG